ncbi:hypothetical protein FGB62_228g013 [Gracilaria domingensis]|nr:hypothetical protein FGB62_228g013 [Gracilaria domingensis]
MLVRWWHHIIRLSHNGIYGSPNSQPYGVLDRRPSAAMFYARIISGILALTAVIFTVSFAGQLPPSGKTDKVTHRDQQLFFGLPRPRLRVILNGSRQIASDGTEFVFQKAVNPRATILLLHGCSHSATDWFPPSEFCRECIGLPEEIRIAYQSLLQGYSVIAVSSTDRKRKCWRTHPRASTGHDYERIESALKVAKNLGVYDSVRPLVALGVSSGGLFASSLPLRSPVTAVNSIVSPSVVNLWTAEFALERTTYAPHVFTHMASRDGHTAKMVASSMTRLLNMGVPCAEFKADAKPVTAKFLADSIPHVNESLAFEIVSALNAAGHLDSVWHLKSDPRQSLWRNVVQHLQNKMGDFLIADASPLSEELNRAWAAHEITAEYIVETLNFFEKTLRMSVQTSSAAFPDSKNA